MSNKKLINGPLNVVRLEGKINGIKKIIYVFFDIHMDVNNQTKCAEFNSIDIVNYLAKEFEAIPDKEIDFFMEGRTSEFELFLKDIYFKDKYISEVIKFFASNFKNKKFNNIRFHYIDIRDFFAEQVENILRINENILTNLNQYKSSSIDIIITNFNTMKTINNKIVKIIEANGNGKLKNNDSQNQKNMYKYIFKLNEKYINDNVKEKMKIFKNLILKKFQKQNKLIDGIIVKLKEYNTNIKSSFDDYGRRIRNLPDNDSSSEEKLPSYSIDDHVYIDEIEKIYEKISYINLQIFSLLMDSYFMRRFCDKDYITHAISYTGSAHSMAYVNFLVNQFDFKITHIAKSDVSIEELNKKLKDKFDFIKFARYFFPKTLLQCVDLSDFPEKFN